MSAKTSILVKMFAHSGALTITETFKKKFFLVITSTVKFRAAVAQTLHYVKV